MTVTGLLETSEYQRKKNLSGGNFSVDSKKSARRTHEHNTKGYTARNDLLE